MPELPEVETLRRSLEGLIRAREASFKRDKMDIAEFRHRRFGGV